MVYRRLGQTDMHVSLLSFGSHTDPADRVRVRQGKTMLTEAGQARRDRIIARAFDLGVNLLDVYDSEGQWEPAARIVKGRRDRIHISLAHEITAQDIDNACRMFGYVDLYRFHTGEIEDVYKRQALYAQLLDRVRALPGVRDAALVFVVPLGGRRGGTNVETGPDETGRRKKVQVGFNVVSPGYFRTVGIPVVRGRDFNASDRPGAAPVALINEEMARRLFPGREPLGVQFRVEWPPAGLVEVVGVVRDGRFRSYRSEIEPTVYLSLIHI